MNTNQFYMKIHKQSFGKVVAVCDEDVLGLQISNKKIQINISEYFYKGELKNIDEVIPILEESNNFNIAGPKIIKAAIQKGIIFKESVLKIGNIPIAMKLFI